jgi:HlyD family secretion protein
VQVGSQVSGIIQSLPVDFNSIVHAGEIVVRLDPSLFDAALQQARAALAQADIGGIRVGENATFEVESYARDTFHGIVSQVRLPVAEQTTTATSTLQSPSTAVATQPTTASSTPTSATPGASTTTVATVISYTVVIEVDNPDEKLQPGMTATLAMDGSRRDNVIRIPNSALSFRPPADVLAAFGQPEARLDDTRDGSAPGRAAHVWQFDSHRFRPTAVRAGLADDNWTELLSGDVRSGESLVTSATVSRRPSR